MDTHSHFSSPSPPSLPPFISPSLAFSRVKDFFNLGLSLLCVLFAALASGLTIGLLSLNTLDLEIKQRVGTTAEQKHATVLLPLLAHRHLLLVTLLLFNSLAAEVLPITLGELVPGYLAVILSVTAVLFFGVSSRMIAFRALPPSLPCLSPPRPSSLSAGRNVVLPLFPSSLPPLSLPGGSLGMERMAPVWCFLVTHLTHIYIFTHSLAHPPLPAP